MTFGEDLKQLSLSVDGIYEGQMARINRIIETYTKKTLNIQSTSVFLVTQENDESELGRYSLGSLNLERTEVVKNDKGEYSGQVPMSFGRRKPVWIVSKDSRGNLKDSDAYKDLWSGIRKIPKYRPRKNDSEALDVPIKTSISIPLRRRRDGIYFGAINFRTSSYLEITEEAKNELTLIAETVSFMFGLYEARKINSKHTDLAIDTIESRLLAPQPRLTKPTIFVASSSEADEEVITSILQILKKQSTRFDFVFWAEMAEPGNIIVQLLKVISKCRYAICYFSEKNEDGEFVDNPNVIFEAGMFHGRTSALGGATSLWIPIREVNQGENQEEKSEDDIFFDLNQERILKIKRNKDGSLKKSAFEAELSQRIDSMILPKDEEEVF